MANDGKSHERNGEPEELSLASYHAQSPANPLVEQAAAILRGVRENSALDQDAVESLIATLFVDLKSKPERHICWYFPEAHADYRPLHVLN
ncbi:MAG: hypothetical protein KDB07_08670, partial [Planctomycetes bacterium]|nr:hypothetical protein [Planctomycetota bacterium]